MSGESFEKGRCPACGSERAEVKAEHKVKYRSHDFDADSYYRILECRGCGEIYFKSAHTNSEDIIEVPDDDVPGGYHGEYVETVHYWPPSGTRKRPNWLDDLKYEDIILGRLLDDVYTAISSDLGVLAAIGMRTTFDRASERLGVDTELSFEKKLKELCDTDHISKKEEKILGTLVEAGSAAAHRGWRPKPDLITAMITILEAFLHRAFILPGVEAQLREDVPKRKPRGKRKGNVQT